MCGEEGYFTQGCPQLGGGGGDSEYTRQGRSTSKPQRACRPRDEQCHYSKDHHRDNDSGKSVLMYSVANAIKSNSKWQLDTHFWSWEIRVRFPEMSYYGCGAITSVAIFSVLTAENFKTQQSAIRGAFEMVVATGSADYLTHFRKDKICLRNKSEENNLIMYF